MITDVQLAAIQTYAMDRLAQDHSGHGTDHLMRVVKLAKRLAIAEQADLNLTLAAAWLHDVIDDKLMADPLLAHQTLAEQLTALHVMPVAQKAIFDIIDHMSFSKSLNGTQTLSLAGQIVQDADRLDAIGAIGIARALYYSGHVGEKIYDPAIEPRLHMTKEQYRNEPGTAINHFYEKLFKLENLMNTDAAKALAHQRTNVMRAFVDQFKAEWQADDQG
ncbi:HD domain-containing protein [Lactiplantibacillus mudanjiangensis]|uniref:Phosphohydrolase [Lactobacillus pentosus] n=1 Tax=Lactiplantibacillus mudanjiangensis TaxID=1296538 RepID=A0A660E5X8_9LACO|nr:HD domain-containing protein [Lactiplantibacillus mudanjiangensis]VDG18907.1 phosphohydrolase [Lactobacillus pentosus] [Lactiplantibacillus mudanjiangensis]VDG25314.1 phosphohydrolase [Lactobacillus pentosus] [Lactiplantibacillus mudanjiangensis]VDG27658.1 phosphohydrolase [Lactobacillus pentosus] [Lactiplantibacillus mudanjiangensis]VDG33007.1 phosphohydrolase [Lactobacillus pentosus] [Lactiplantibacillus mudanjiangensis]